MQKSLYSLILTDEIVNRIDNIARQQNTNRSNLINQILADYVSYTTPEKKIERIFEVIDNLFINNTVRPIFNNHDRTMSIESSLPYRYRPTIKYCVELYKKNTNNIGVLKILYRTQSEKLLQSLKNFFIVWQQIEEDVLDHPITYFVEDGKLTRTLTVPFNQNYTNDEIARAIADYVKFFNVSLNKFLSGDYNNVAEIEYEFKIYHAKSLTI